MGLRGQCPEITNSTISPGACASSCLLCPGDELTITVEGYDLPDPGNVNFYYSNTPGFDPYGGQGTFIGSAAIMTPQRMPCDDCPSMEAIMVNACGNEAQNEFIMMSSGSGFDVNDLSLNLPNGGFCGFSAAPNTGVVSGCNVVGVGPGGSVPAGALVVILVSSNANQVYDFSGSCPNGETVYVLMNSCPLMQPAFRNECVGCGPRVTTFSLGCGCSGGLTYFPEDLMDVDGEYVEAGGTPGAVPCNSAPAISVQPPSPIPSTVQPFTYVIPPGWCDQGPREIVGILSPAPTPPCLAQYTFRYTVEVRCPDANGASAQACDNGNGRGTFDLGAIEDQVTGGGGFQVNWWRDMNGTVPISSPYTTVSTTVYASIVDGCESDPVAVVLTVLPKPVARMATDMACDEGGGVATFELTNLVPLINGGTGREVRFYLDLAATVRLLPPYTTSSTTIYATVLDGQCESDPVLVNLVVLPAPRAVAATAEACDEGNGTARFDLTELESIINEGSGMEVKFFKDINLSVPAPNPYVGGSTVLYAVVNNGSCDSQPVEVRLDVVPEPVAMETTETICDNGSGVASFDLEALDDRVRSGGTGSVSYHPEEGSPQRLMSPYVSGPDTIYARVSLGDCVSEDVPVILRVLAAPAADTAAMTACSDAMGKALFELELIEDTVNMESGEMVEWSSRPDFSDTIRSPYESETDTIFARVFNGGCYSVVVPVYLEAVPGPRLDSVADTSACVFFILPEIRGSGLTGMEAYYTMPSGMGEVFVPGDSIFDGRRLYVYDRSMSGLCASEWSFEVSIDDAADAGDDRSVSVCEGTVADLENLLRSHTATGRFEDIDMTGQLSGSLFQTAGLSGASYRFRHILEPSGECPGDTAVLEVEVVSSVSAGTGVMDSVCAGEEVLLFDLLRGGDPGGQFTALTPGLTIVGDRVQTAGVSAGDYDIKYLVGDGVSCPKDSATLTLRILAAPGLDDPGPLRGCDFVVLPGISGVHLTVGASYYTAANGGGTALEAGDSLWQDTRIYLFDSNGLCSDEKVIDIRIGTASTLTVSSALCPGEVYEIAGERFDEQRSSGSVILPGANRYGCDSVIQVSISYFPAAAGRLDMSLCPGENLFLHGETFDAARPEGSVLLPGAGSHGCDSTVEVRLSYYPEAVGSYAANACAGDTVYYNGRIYVASRPGGVDTLWGAAGNGCDSIVEISIDFLPAASSELRLALCPGEQVTVNGRVYDEGNPSGTETLAGQSAVGCDSIVTVALTFHEEAKSLLRRDLCYGQSVTVNGRVYDENNPAGTEILPGQSAQGCDSIVEIDLRFSDAAYNRVNERLCPGEFLLVNNVRYDAGRPTGRDTLFGASSSGCDSIIAVELEFFEEARGRYEASLCADETVRIGGMVFSRENPTGTALLPGSSARGCDSLVDVSLDFGGGVLELPAEYVIAPGETVELEAIFSGTAVHVQWMPAEGLSCSDCLRPLATPAGTRSYTLVVEDENGCIFTATTRVRIDENFRVFLPNAFTPNDDGINDRFVVSTSEQVTRIDYVRIFDRWGTLVYAEENVLPDQQLGWDGSYRGKVLNPAVFVVLVGVEFSGGKQQIFRGDLTLIR